MAFEMMYGQRWNPPYRCQRNGETGTHQQGTSQTGTGGVSNGIQLVERRCGLRQDTAWPSRPHSVS